MRGPRTVGRIDGDEIREAVLEEGDVSVSVLSYGAITRDWRVPVNGARRPVVLGFADPSAYARNPGYLGVIAGRVANRTGYGRFELDGHTVQLGINDLPHHLHGGTRGLPRRNWRIETDSTARRLRLSYHSPDGEEGYPGSVDFRVDISLKGYRLCYDMQASVDRVTPVNLAQHNYYNLAGGGDIRDHVLRLAASRYTPADATLLPTGQIVPVADTRFDFTTGRRLSEADPDARGYDVNMVLDDTGDQPAATVTAAGGTPILRMWTDQPGLQLYTAGHLVPATGAHDGQKIGPWAGLCLEPQGFPDALNKPGFPSILCSPDAPYRQKLEVEIAP